MNNTVYIGGKMTGLPDWGEESFRDAEDYLRSNTDWAVINPARSFCGVKTLPRPVYLRYCVHALLQVGQVVFIPGWMDSKGAKLEYSIAKELNLPIYVIEEDSLTPIHVPHL
jgi:hypothetical protein